MVLGLAALLRVLSAGVAALPTVEIEWTAPEACPDRAWLEGRIERFLDRALQEAAVEPVSASVTVTAAGEGLSARVVLRTGDREQTRTLADESCEVLAAATAFMIAVAIDPDATFESDASADADPSPPAPAPAPAPAPVHATPTRPVLPRPDAARRPSRGAIAVAGTGAGGILPGFAPGLALTGAWIVRRARVELSGAWTFEKTDALGEPRSASYRLWAVGAGACGVPVAPAFEFPLCAGVEAGSLRGRSRGVSDPASDAVAWIAARAGPSVAYVPSRFAAVFVGVDAVIPLRRPQFEIEGLGVVHQTWPVAFRGRLGVEVRFP